MKKGKGKPRPRPYKSAGFFDPISLGFLLTILLTGALVGSHYYAASPPADVEVSQQ